MTKEKSDSKKVSIDNKRLVSLTKLDDYPTDLYGDPIRGKIINTLLKLKALGKSESTLKFVSSRLRYLAKNVWMILKRLIFSYVERSGQNRTRRLW